MRVGVFSPRKSASTRPPPTVCAHRLTDLFKKPAVADKSHTIFREKLLRRLPRKTKNAASGPKISPKAPNFTQSRAKLSWNKAGFHCHKSRENTTYPRNGLKHKKEAAEPTPLSFLPQITHFSASDKRQNGMPDDEDVMAALRFLVKTEAKW